MKPRDVVRRAGTIFPHLHWGTGFDVESRRRDAQRTGNEALQPRFASTIAFVGADFPRKRDGDRLRNLSVIVSKAEGRAQA